MSVKHAGRDGQSPKRRKLSHSPEEDKPEGFTKFDSADDSSEDSGGSHDNGVSAKSKSTEGGPKSRPGTARKPAVLPTGGINRAAVLALQVADLSAELTPNYERLRPKWTKISSKLVSLIKETPDRSPVTAVEALKSFRKQGIRIPFPQPQPSKDTNYKFEFRTPSQVVVGGALPWNLSLKNERVIELTAIMPDDLLQEKDYLNNRAFHKAAFYLACFAAAFKKLAAGDFQLSFVHREDNDLLPIIEVTPKDEINANFRFHVSVGFPKESIPISKTLPMKNCLRQESSDSQANADRPTPCYNSSIRYAASTAAFDHLIQSTRSPSFDEACRLGQVWLRQRGFSSSSGAGGFGFWEWTLTCALLLKSGGHRGHPLFSKQYSSLQFFKAMLQILGGRDLRDPMILNAAKLEITKSDLPVLFDGNTGVNILYKMSPWSYQALRHHAQVSLAAINSRNQDGFDATFMANVALPVLQYDEIHSIQIPSGSFSTTRGQHQFLQEMYSTFKRGLGDRATLIDFKTTPQHCWSLDQESNLYKEDYTLEIALLINPDAITRIVDHGPSADEPEEAAEFRKFWGEKAELRRFKDGSISESLIWASNSPITVQIISYLAMFHFNLLPSSITTKTQDLEQSVLVNDSPVSPKDAFRLINSTFQKLTSTLHGLEGLPLPIRSILPADAKLRSSSVGHPLLPVTTSPIDMIVQFDSSTRWPDSLPAIQHTKIAFLLKLAELLTESDPELKTRVGLENTESATTGHLNSSFLDIIHPSPAAGMSPICFRARIHHDREAHLLQTALADKSLHGSLRDSFTSALAIYKRDFLAKPIHTTTMRNLCTKFPPLSTTVRLLKKWVASHLLLDHIPEEILEIIAANAFLRPAPWSAPGSSTTAFLRCLHLLSRWDWVYSPLIVDVSLSQDLTAVETSEMQTRFEAWRKLDPNMNNVVWFVGTNLDPTGTVWTQGSRPPRVVAGRVVALARAAIEVVETQGTKMHDAHWTDLFSSPLSDFDFQLHLKPAVVRSHGFPTKAKSKSKSALLNGGATTEFKNLQLHASLDIDSIGHDPVGLFLRDLTHAFGATALFFRDPYGGAVIAGLWKPGAQGTKEWRVRLGWSSVPVPPEEGNKKAGEGKGSCVLNKEGILAEMAILGQGIVREIKVKH